MKKIIISAMLLIIANASFSQQTNPSTVLTKENYLLKSKKQKILARILLGGGAAFAITGMIIPKGEIVHEGFLGNDYKNDGIKGTLKLTGILSMAGSIPLFITSSKNKKKVTAVLFKNETIPQLQKSSFVYKTIPSLTLKISL
jgi:hypothetical protein